MERGKTDIRTFTPVNNTQPFCLDTNVLYWYTYPRYIQQANYADKKRGQYYFNFVDKLVENGNPLITTSFNIVELMNIVERHELEIYQTLNPDAPYSKKDLRKMPDQRNQLKQILSTTLTNVKQICDILETNDVSTKVNEFIVNLDKHQCDVSDYIVLLSYREKGLINVITDDGDFSSIDGIKLFTANI